MTFQAAVVPRVTQEFYEHIKRKVPPLIVEPGSPHNELMYTAGMHKVLEWINEAIGTMSDKPNREV